MHLCSSHHGPYSGFHLLINHRFLLLVVAFPFHAPNQKDIPKPRKPDNAEIPLPPLISLMWGPTPDQWVQCQMYVYVDVCGHMCGPLR